jgi:hypothetical protein
MNIFLASSWKNRDAVRKMATLLRERGFEVYDFTDPACRKTPEIPPEAYPEQFDPARMGYADYLKKAPAWREAVMANKDAIDACDVVVLMLPCGNDAHADWAYGVGRGKRSIVYGAPRAGERSPVHMWADVMTEEPIGVLVTLQLWVCER